MVPRPPGVDFGKGAPMNRARIVAAVLAVVVVVCCAWSVAICRRGPR